MPMERAVPAMILGGGVSVVGVQVGHLGLADLTSLSMVIEPTLAVFGVPEPFWTPAAFLMSSAAGGVLRTNVKVRSS